VSRSRRGFAPFGRLAVAAAVVGLVPAAGACDAGNNAPTTQFHPQSVGVDAMVHGIDIKDAFVLGAQLGASLPAGKTAGLFLALINVGGSLDRLVSVTAPGTATSVVLPPGGIVLHSQQAAYLVGPEPRLVLDGLIHPLAGGQTVRITLDFMKAGTVTLTVPVLPRSNDYATFSPAPNPSAIGSAAAHLVHSAHPRRPASRG
jgi:copper(I)-binding protein